MTRSTHNVERSASKWVNLHVRDKVTGKEWTQTYEEVAVKGVIVKLMSEDKDNRLELVVDNPWSSAT